MAGPQALPPTDGVWAGRLAGIPPRGMSGSLRCRSILRPHDKSPKVSFEPPWHGTLETFDSRRAGDGREPCNEAAVSPDSVKTAAWRVAAVVRIAANRPNPYPYLNFRLCGKGNLFV